MATAVREGRSLNELTQAVFGEVLTLNQVFERVEYDSWSPSRASHVPAAQAAVEQLWVGSIG